MNPDPHAMEVPVNHPCEPNSRTYPTLLRKPPLYVDGVGLVSYGDPDTYTPAEKRFIYGKSDASKNHSFYIYGDFELGPHYPEYRELELFDGQIVYHDCPELMSVMDHNWCGIEVWTPEGFFTPIQPYERENLPSLTDHTPFTIIRPGQQPDDYMTNCIGFRELTYDLHVSSRKWRPIQRGICPPDTARILLEVGTRMSHLHRLLNNADEYQLIADVKGARPDGKWSKTIAGTFVGKQKSLYMQALGVVHEIREDARRAARGDEDDFAQFK